MTNPPAARFVKQLALNGVFWNGLGTSLRVGFQLGVSIILARLLSPEEFGIVALVYVFTGIAGMMIESGLGYAVVQLRNLQDEELSTLFHFQWALALILGAALGLSAPWIATFCGYPILESLIWTISLTLVINAIGGVHAGLLSRALDFRPLMIVGSTSTLVSGAIAVILAVKGFGVWALALQPVVASVVNVCGLWVSSQWRPRLIFRPNLLGRFFGFGGYILGSGLLDALYGRLCWLIIGKMYGAADLGQYNRASGTQGMPSGMITGIIGNVAFPAFSALQGDRDKLKSGLRKVLIAVMAINIPAMLGLLAVAEPLVLTLFGLAWQPSVPLLQILCLAGLLFPLHVINLNVLLAQGHSRLFFRIEVVKKAVGVISTLAALPFGLAAFAWSQVLYAAFCFAIHAHYTKRLLGYGGLSQVFDCLPWLYAGIVMVGVIWLGQLMLPTPSPIRLLAQIVLGSVTYLGFWLAWDASLLREMVFMLIPGAKARKA